MLSKYCKVKISWNDSSKSKLHPKKLGADYIQGMLATIQFSILAFCLISKKYHTTIILPTV
jgi:hypothetical protein